MGIVKYYYRRIWGETITTALHRHWMWNYKHSAMPEGKDVAYRTCKYHVYKVRI